MSKFKKVLLAGASYVLVTALAIGGTVAYLTDTDSNVNVMTLGNVSIRQHEYQRAVDSNGDYKSETIDNVTSYVLESFEQGKAILPTTESTNNGAGPWDLTTVRMTQVDSYGGMQVFTSKNAVDKFVTVENTGKTDAYVRTIVAIEVGSTDDSLLNISNHFTWNVTDFDSTTDKEKEPLKITIDSNNYMLYEFVYNGWDGGNDGNRHLNGILPAGETSYPSLSQVYIHSDATNEDMKNIDGNGNGMLDILVVSQAVQADGFSDAKIALDTAFGEISTTNHPWVDAVVSDANTLTNAVKAGATTVILSDNITLNEVLEVSGTLTIVGNGNTLTVPANGTRVVNVNDNDENVELMLSNVTIDAANAERGISFYNNTGDLTVTVINSHITAEHYGINVASNNKNAVLNVKDSTITGYCAFQTWSANTVATFDNCVLEGLNKWDNPNGSTTNNFATIVINEGADNCKISLNNCTVVATENNSATEYHLINRSSDSLVNWNDCTFIKNNNKVESPVLPNN